MWCKMVPGEASDLVLVLKKGIKTGTLYSLLVFRRMSS